MQYKRLFILIEGDDDKRFFNKVINPLLSEIYDSIFLWQYSQKKKKKINNFIKSIKDLYADYIYVTDINDEPCVSGKKIKIQDKYPIIDNENKIAIVIKEIESWYLAGLSNNDSNKLIKKTFRSTDNIIKEQFNKLIPKRFDSRIDFMVEILKYFSVDVAKRKNKSLSYFIEKYVQV